LSRRSPRLCRRFVVAAALLGYLVSALPFRGQVHAATQPQRSGVIALNHHLTLGNGTFNGNPGATISVGPNGVITVSGSTGPVQVIPNRGYVLALYNTTTGRWEAVLNNTIRPGTGTFALIPVNAVHRITALGIQLAGVRGGRSAPCRSGYDREGRVVQGCQIVTLTAPIQAGSHLTFTVRYAAAPQLKQSFVATADGHGHYRGAFPVLYKPPAGSKQGVLVTVSVRVSLRNYSYWGTATRRFVAMPAPSQPRRAPHTTPHATVLGFRLTRVVGGRTAPCAPAHDRQGHVLPGCQIVTVTAPAQSHLNFTVRYPDAPQLKQTFAATVDAHGHYRGAFPVMYKPAARNEPAAIVRVTVRVTLPNGSSWGTATLCFLDMPASGNTHPS
jgi:hypothetical protein